MKRAIVAATILSTLTGSVSCYAMPGLAEGKDASEASAADAPVIRLQVPILSPLFESTPVALVNDEKITIDDLLEAVIVFHGATSGESGGKRDYTEALNRLINVKLLVQEAREIGLDQLPELKDDLTEYRELMLRESLFHSQVQDVKADEKDVEKLYRRVATEWKVTSLAFTKKEDAAEFLKELKAGKSFESAAAKAVADGSANQAKADAYMLKTDSDARINNPIMEMKAGDISPIIAMDNDFLVFRLDDSRLPDKPELKREARKKVLSATRLKALEKMKADMLKKNATINEKLLKSLDFEAKKPGFDAMLKDKRVLATIKGGRKITVGDLAQGLVDKYFHGVETAIREKKVNMVKPDVLDEMLSKIVFRQVALEQGLDKSQAYLKQVEKHESQLLFGGFIEKAVRPSVVTRLDDLKAYYEEHKSEFTTPATLGIDEIIFKSAPEAQAAVDKLRKNVEFKWLKENSAKVADAELAFGGQMFAVDTLPEDVQKLLSGVREGEFKVYSSPQGLHYVLYVQQVIPSKQSTLDEVSDIVVPAVFTKKLGQAVDAYVSKLKEASDIKNYLYKAE